MFIRWQCYGHLVPSDLSICGYILDNAVVCEYRRPLDITFHGYSFSAIVTNIYRSSDLRMCVVTF